jgi:dolichol-phosphate mannosyltransferase
MIEGKISVVVPAFDEAENIPVLVDRLHGILTRYSDYELLIIDDGSRDHSLDVLRRLSAEDDRICFLSLSRNFGHQNALKAGLDHAQGDCVIMLDADMQHPPVLIPSMIERWSDGFEIVNMIRRDENAPAFKRVTAALFYRFVNAISDFKIRPGASDFRLLDRKVVDVLRGLGERTLFFRGLVPWLGFRQCDIEYTPDARAHGRSKYDFGRMMLLALDGIISSSTRPLRLSTLLGLGMSILAMLYATYAVTVKLAFGTAVSGWASLLTGVMLLGGVQLVMLGILGEYIGRVLLEIKGRPPYIVRERSEPSGQNAVARLQARLGQFRALP